MFPFFEGHEQGIYRSESETRYELNIQHGHPGNYKELPENSASPSYWYGFISGIIAADGNVDNRDGCVIISQANKAALANIMEHLPRVGMVATSLGGPYEHEPVFTREDGTTYSNGVFGFYNLRLMRNFMEVDDFLIPEHKENFTRNANPDSPYGTFVGIRALRETDDWEEVFCCEEPTTHTFTVGNGVLTGNCYGNSFARIHLPFDRYLIDKRNGRSRRWSITQFGNAAKYNYGSMTYTVPDPVYPGKSVNLPFADFQSKDLSRVAIRLVDPRRVRLHHSWISGRTQVVYRFEEWFLSDIKQSKLWQVNETPISMLRAIRNNQDYLFNEGEIYHFRAPMINGLSNAGWGLPEVIANYRSIHQLQVYRMTDEAVGRDYVLPFRLFSPPSTGGGNDASTMFQNRASWKNNVMEMIKNRRRDPFSMHAFPDPVQYQEFGADQHKQMMTKDQMEYHTNSLLDGAGYPAELFRGSLQVAQIPTTLRLFENTHRFIHFNFNKFAQWVTNKVADFSNRPRGGVSLQLPSLADDLEKRQIYMQLGAAGELPRSTYLRPIGIDDPVQAVKERMLEDIEVERERNQIQKDFEREQTMGSPEDIIQQQMGEEGAAGPGGTTPMDRMSEAEEIAAGLLQEGITDGDRRRQLQDIQAADPQLHAMVKQKIEEIRSLGESQGRQMANAGQLQ
jgi:hypothetical protein